MDEILFFVTFFIVQCSVAIQQAPHPPQLFSSLKEEN